ncbi:aldehyde dehydrogenase family protein [Streptomyces sp. XM4011]|uniref:aldehyde dehydrogenase family protein n=1 Tax=Streptomyces sp. XM4011 TaxID=2929780 RepID=UPI001FFB0477|nr:aldehyde dehydrogenase family protein [Streptomyces sp. XM4011]MCK1815685.1 aldehyde dehydrogenase family protein [Streptomyces sp. XM4011]
MDIRLDALGPNGAYASRNRQVITDVAGTPLGELSLVPRLFVNRTMTALRNASPLPPPARLAAIAEAGRAFSQDTIGGLSVTDYQYAVSRVSGLPLSTTVAAVEATVTTTRHAEAFARLARPAGAVNDWRDGATRRGSAVWTRRGEVFSVHAPGNTPSIHNLWMTALAQGYRVAIRPSAREPFSPHRMVTALRAAGFGDDQVALLPTDHDVADAVVGGADLALAYGGDDVVRKYERLATLLPQGPGRSKFLITGDWQPHLDTIVAAVSGHGGTACVNTTAVFVAGDPAPLAEALADRLSRLPSLPPEHPEAVLPVQPVDAARALEIHLLARAEGTRAWLGGEGFVDELGDGSAVLRPSVRQVDRADAPQTRVELPFPCVWLSPWSPSDGIGMLRDTLVLTAATDDERLIDRLLAEPSIANLYIGDHPTHWMAPGIPHDDYLESFLMRTKAVIR